jgi:hypothetical protein
MTRFKSAVTGAISILCIYTLLVGSAHAAIYKWVDENGNVQYTQTPPPANVKAETIQPPPPDTNSAAALKQLSDQEQQLKDMDKQRKEQADKEAKAAEELALQQKNCQMAKDRLASYARPRVKFVQPDGTRVRATEEERQEQIKKSEDMIKEFCKE